MAVIFIGSFTSAALLHRYTAVALLLCGVAIATLVVSVIGANVRSPRRWRGGVSHIADEPRPRSVPAKRPPQN